MGKQTYVSLSVGMWRAFGNPNPCKDLEILHEHPHLSKEDFGAVLTPAPSLLRGSESLKAEGHVFENCLQNKRC